ncbi:MAG: hypothetical protein ABI835_15870, partial [Chloroflexota bacterium]
MSYDDPTPNDDSPLLPNDAETPVEPVIAPIEEKAFEDLTLAEAAGQLWRSPISTLRALKTVAQTPTYTRQRAQSPSVFAPPLRRSETDPISAAYAFGSPPVALVRHDDQGLFPAGTLLTLAQWLMRLLAFALAVVGGGVMFANPVR